MKVPPATIWAFKRLVFFRRAIDPMNGVGLGQIRHLFDPIEQMSILAQRYGRSL